jgi:hypothetical protein
MVGTMDNLLPILGVATYTAIRTISFSVGCPGSIRMLSINGAALLSTILHIHKLSITIIKETTFIS